MGSAPSSHRSSSIKQRTIEFDEKRLENLELFTLIYLSDEFNRDIQQNYRTIIDYLCYFDSFEKCQQFISNRTSLDKLFVIISNSFAEKFVSNHHNLNQINFIYILEQNSIKQTNFIDELWTKKYPKVKESFSCVVFREKNDEIV